MISTDKEFVNKTVIWFKLFYRAVYRAGGDPSSVIKLFPYELMETMIRNDLYITFRKPTDEN